MQQTVTAFVSIFLNLFMPEEEEDEAPSITANEVDVPGDREEWQLIQHKKGMEVNGVRNVGKIGKMDEEKGGQ